MENHCPHLAPSPFSLKIQKGILFGHYTKKRSAAVFFVDFHKKVCYHIVDIVLFCAVSPPCPKSMPFEASKESILPYAAVYSLTPLFLHMVSYAVFPVDAVRRATSERDSDGARQHEWRLGILPGDHREPSTRIAWDREHGSPYAVILSLSDSEERTPSRRRWSKAA